MKLTSDTVQRFGRVNKLVPKMICLLLSIVLWGYITTSQGGRALLKIPIELKNLPERHVISEISNKYVYVTLIGKKDYLKNITMKNLMPYVDLANPIVDESKSYTIQWAKQQVPESVNINPSIKDVTLKVERLRDKWVKVAPKIAGTVAPGKMMGRIRAVPEFVLVTGASSAVKQIEFVLTDDISVEGASEDLQRNVELNLDSYKDLTFNETTIRVTIPVLKAENIYALEVPLAVYKVIEGYRAELPESKVRISIRAADGVRLETGDLEAFIDAGQLLQLQKTGKAAMEKMLPVSVRVKGNKIPLGDIISIVPESMNVRIVKK